MKSVNLVVFSNWPEAAAKDDDEEDVGEVSASVKQEFSDGY